MEVLINLYEQHSWQQFLHSSDNTIGVELSFIKVRGQCRQREHSEIFLTNYFSPVLQDIPENLGNKYR